jgi:LmbE family N-acetylglucosaminyl deacetylase
VTPSQPDPPSGPLLLLSPHFDDAALSCSALLERGERVQVVTVFAGEPSPPRRGEWDEVCGFRDSAESLRTRRAEDERALAEHELSFLPLHEGQYLEGPRPVEDAGTLADAVVAADGVLAVPAGAGWRGSRLRRRLERALRRRVDPGRHPDHVFVRDAALAAAGDRSVVLYEEVPYAFGGVADGEAAAVARLLGRELVALELPVDREAKAKRLAAYESQLPFIWDERLDRAEALPPVERYWLLPR